MIQPIVRIVLLEDDQRVYHFVGEYVAVAFEVHPVTSTSVEDGATMTHTRWVRSSATRGPGGPYIAILAVRNDGGQLYRHDDFNPIGGGIGTAEAREYAADLVKAADYLDAIARGEVAL